MSFGYSVGDFVAIAQLTWSVYRSCGGAPGEFQELSRELSSLHTILHELEDEARSPTSLLNRRGTARKPELDILVDNLSGVLRQIEDIVKRYHSLGRDQKRTWDRVKFATEDLTTLRAKLSFHVNAIELFISSLSAGSLARIEGILDELVRDIKAGRKEPTIISTHEDDDEVAWSELERELVGDGITRQDVDKYKEDIKEYLKKLIQENLMGVGSGSNDSLDANFEDLGIEDEASELHSFDVRSEQPRSVWRPSTSDFSFLQEPVSTASERQRDGLRTGYSESSDLRREGSPRIGQDSNMDESDQQVRRALPVGLEYIRKDGSAAKPVFLKGLFSCSITSTMPAPRIFTDIARVLRQLGVEYSDIQGGFSCRHAPTIAPKRVYSLSLSKDLSHSFRSQRRRPLNSIYGENNGDATGDLRETYSNSETSRANSIRPLPILVPHGMHDTLHTGYRNPYSNSMESLNSGAGDVTPPMKQSILPRGMILVFEMMVVKVPLLSLHGVQFKRIKGDTWQYKNRADQILRELRI